MKGYTSKHFRKSVYRLALIVLCGAILGFNIYFANAKNLVGNQLPMPFGYGLAVVLSGSMEPEISQGDLIIVKRADTIEMNQVIVYQEGRSLIVHRIIEIDGDTVVTQGDANNVADDPIHISSIKGTTVAVIPCLGSVIEAIKSPVGTALIIISAILLLEIPRAFEKRRDAEKAEIIKEEIRKLKNANKQ